jgi:hypothetical protein
MRRGDPVPPPTPTRRPGRQGMPLFRTGAVDSAAAVPVGPAGACVERALLPDSDEWDADVVVVDVKPGFAAPAVRAHWNNLGALLLTGEGIFRLGESWCGGGGGGEGMGSGPVGRAHAPAGAPRRAACDAPPAGMQLPMRPSPLPPDRAPPGTPSRRATPCGRHPTCRSGLPRSGPSPRGWCCTGTATSTPSSWCDGRGGGSL